MRLRSFLVLFGLTNSSAALLAQGQAKLCFGYVIMGLWGAGSTHVKSPSWGPADWIGVSGLLEVEDQLAQKLTCLFYEQWT